MPLSYVSARFQRVNLCFTFPGNGFLEDFVRFEKLLYRRAAGFAEFGAVVADSGRYLFFAFDGFLADVAFGDEHSNEDIGQYFLFRSDRRESLYAICSIEHLLDKLTLFRGRWRRGSFPLLFGGLILLLGV